MTPKENVVVKNTLLETNVKCVPNLTEILQNVTNVKAITMDIRLARIVLPVIVLVVEVKTCNAIKKLGNVNAMKTLLERNVTHVRLVPLDILNVKVMNFSNLTKKSQRLQCKLQPVDVIVRELLKKAKTAIIKENVTAKTDTLETNVTIVRMDSLWMVKISHLNAKAF